MACVDVFYGGILLEMSALEWVVDGTCERGVMVVRVIGFVGVRLEVLEFAHLVVGEEHGRLFEACNIVVELEYIGKVIHWRIVGRTVVVFIQVMSGLAMILIERGRVKNVD